MGRVAELAGDPSIPDLVYDPATLDLSLVTLGVTSAADVLALVEENELCASLDVEGGIVYVNKCE